MERLLFWAVCCSKGAIFHLVIFFSWIRMCTSSSTDSMRSGGHEEGGEVFTRFKLHAFDYSRVRLPRLGLIEVMTPFIATFLIGFGMMLPTCLSVLALIVDNRAIMSRRSPDDGETEVVEGMQFDRVYLAYS